MARQRRPGIGRRGFLRVAGAGLAALVSGLACGRRRLAELTRTVAAIEPALSPPTALPQATAPAAAPTTAPTIAHVVAPTTPPPAPTAAPELAADMVLLNGKVITVDAQDRIASALAVKDGLIQAVGDEAQVGELLGERTTVIDLGGKAVTPGLIDAHNHFQVMGLMNSYYLPLMPPEVRTIQDLQAKLAEAVGRTPAGEWVNGYFMVVTEGRLPNRHDLDPVSPNHPVWVIQQGGHYGSANSLAMQMAGITAATPDPSGGLIEREANGEPSGVFYNHRAMDLLRRVIPQPTMADVERNIVSTLPLFAACGVTSFQDNNVRGVDTVHTYRDVGQRGEMTLRGDVFYTLEWPGDLERALNEIERFDEGGFMRFAGCKFLLDGQLKMAFCHQPHQGVRWDLPTWEPQSFKDAVRALHDTGLQICVHCAGDAAVDLTLDAFEEAMDANPRPDPRHRIEHCVLCTPEATRRMKDLGVVVSTQPQFIRLGGDAYPGLFGEERSRRVIVTREWLDEGVALALGSDSPTTPWYTPQVTLFGAITRLTFSNQRYNPEQALTIQEALRAHTMGSAYAAHQEKVKGSIEAGKLADLVVWAEDPYTVATQRLWQTPIAMTIVGGKIVHQL